MHRPCNFTSHLAEGAFTPWSEALWFWLWGKGGEQSGVALPLKVGSSQTGLGIFWVLCTQAFLHPGIFACFAYCSIPLAALLPLSLCFASSKSIPHSMAFHPTPFFPLYLFPFLQFFPFFFLYFFLLMIF